HLTSLDCFLYVTLYSSFFFFNDTSTTDIYTLSLHDALPISILPFHTRNGSATIWLFRCFFAASRIVEQTPAPAAERARFHLGCPDRKSTRLNSSHRTISYAVFCLKKKKNKNK